MNTIPTINYSLLVTDSIPNQEIDRETTYLIHTHDGVFHADDVLAVAIIIAFEASVGSLKRTKAVVVRSRAIHRGIADYTVDVGGQYDSVNHMFDHHQQGGAGARQLGAATGVPYASAGLVWLRLGRSITRAHPHREIAFSSMTAAADPSGGLPSAPFGVAASAAYLVDSNTIAPVDATDTGYSRPGPGVFTWASSIASFNPTWLAMAAIPPEQQAEAFNERFVLAVDYAVRMLMTRISSAIAEVAGQSYVRQAVVTAKTADKSYVLLDQYVPWLETVVKHELSYNVKFVVFPAIDGTWRAQEVPIYLGNDSPIRCKFPKEWHGLRGDELSDYVGIPGCVFCHNNGFVVAHSTMDGVISMVEKAIAADLNPPREGGES